MSLLVLLCIASSFCRLAFAASIPQDLQSSIPDCARSCFASYIQGNYPSSICTDNSNVDCLCSHKGVQGFTLQEGAFVCAHQECLGQANEGVIDSTYDICNGRPGALSATHTLLPITFTVRPTSVRSTTSSVPSHTMSSAITASTSSTSTIAVMSSSASPSATAVASHGLSTSQIVGISVACAAAAVVVVSIAIFLACMRRRRRNHERLDSGKLSYEEFKPPSIDEKRVVPGPTGLKDPRGGPGGVGVAPVKYKAILPPANLFAQPPMYPGSQAPLVHNSAQASSPAPARIEVPAPIPSPAAAEIHIPPPAKVTNSVLSGVTSIASSHYSLDRVGLVPNAAQRPVNAYARPPSALLPGRHVSEAAARGLSGRESSASQFTQFEEDAPLQSATIPVSVTSRPLYPQKNSSTSSSSSQGVSCSSSSTTPSARKSRGPSLRISIPGKRRSYFDFPPPPPQPSVKARGPQRPSLAAAEVASQPFLPASQVLGHRLAGPPNDQAQIPAMSQPSTSDTMPYAAPPPQFPGPPTGRLVAQGPPPAPRKDSVSRRGFSQPNATAYLNASAGGQSKSPRQVGNQPQLSVNGERINYPSIPRPTMSPPKTFPMPSPPAAQPFEMPFPPPPPGPPPRFVGTHVAHTHSSSQDTTGSDSSNAQSLLAKRRGSERAAVLEKQIKIHNSHGSTSHKPAVMGTSSITTTPQSLRGAGHGRVDSKTNISPPEVLSAPVQQSVQKSPPPMNVRQWPTAAHVRQGSGNQRWMAQSGVPAAQVGPQQQYVAYHFPPPPPRPGVQSIQPPLMSPTPAQMTPTRRGGDMYLSIQ